MLPNELPRILEAAKNGEPLTKLEALALADACEKATARVAMLESALDTAQIMINVRPVTGETAILTPAA